MEHMIDKLVRVHLKGEDTVDGIFVGAEQKHVYLRSENNMFVIPQDNIKYYQIQVEEEEKAPVQQQPRENAINVSVNGAFLTKILVPPGMNLASANEEVLRMIWANLDVQSALRGRVQKTLEYAPGEANIILADFKPEQPQVQDDGFSMGTGTSPVLNYLSPSEMVSRLQNAGKKEKKNE